MDQQTRQRISHRTRVGRAYGRPLRPRNYLSGAVHCMNIDDQFSLSDLLGLIPRLFALATAKIKHLDQTWDPFRGAPVFTVAGQYATRGWTEWTEGFQYGCALLAFDATGDRDLLDL